MPMHDWTRVEAGIFHAFHHEWVSEIGRALNRGLLPADYYARAHRPRVRESRRHPALRIGLTIAKNILGVVLLLIGIVTLLLPGQGLLTILIALLLLDLPGKYQVERWIMSRRGVNRAINWLRGRAGRPPLQIRARQRA